MAPRVLALTITAALALGMAGSASSQSVVEKWNPATGTWVSVSMKPSSSNPIEAMRRLHTYTYGVNGKKRTCTLTRGAKCAGATLRGKVKHHGDLRKVDLRRADLRFADLRGANLQGADLRSTNLMYADLRGANLQDAKFHYAAPVHGKKEKQGRSQPSCYPTCQGANLHGADLSGANLLYANLSDSDLSNANASNADLRYANMTRVDLSYTNFYGANLTYAYPPGAIWNHTTCPDGTVTNIACS